METARIQITGMHCTGYIRTVTNALKRVSGVKEADVSL
jgi:copper chaperone CopZ